MTKTETIRTLRKTALRIFAIDGYEGLTMRILAKESGIGLSSIYHFFEDKDVLLKDIFDTTNTYLGEQRRTLKQRATTEEMLHDRIDFQFTYMEEVVFVLKYYLHYRDVFMALPDKILPPKAYLHIEEVLHRGIGSGEFALPNNQIESMSKIITHSINGFLLEYYPHVPKGKERKELVTGLTTFVMRSLKYKEAPMR